MATTKFLDLQGLKEFSSKVKSYVDGKDNALSDRIGVASTDSSDATGLWAKVEEVEELAQTAVDAAGVTSFGGKTGAITVKAAGANNGDVNLSVSDAGEVSAAIVGLGTAAFTDADAYATAEQGAKADAAETALAGLDGTVAEAIAAAKAEIIGGEDNEELQSTYNTLKAIAEWIDANDEATDAAGLAKGVADNAAAIGTANTAAEGEVSNATGLYLKIEQAQAAATHAKTTVTAGTANGTISVDGGVDLTVYTHPADKGVVEATAVKVGHDAEGHVVLGDALAASDVAAAAVAASDSSEALAEGTVASQLSALAVLVKSASASAKAVQGDTTETVASLLTKINTLNDVDTVEGSVAYAVKNGTAASVANALTVQNYNADGSAVEDTTYDGSAAVTISPITISEVDALCATAFA